MSKVLASSNFHSFILLLYGDSLGSRRSVRGIRALAIVDYASDSLSHVSIDRLTAEHFFFPMTMQLHFGDRMLQLITNASYADFADALGEMFQLRARVFSGRLGWDVSVVNGMERDRFDDLEPIYILQRDRDERVCGCVRLLPTTGPTMLRDTFPQLLHGAPMPSDGRIWETSRFAIDAPAASAVGAGGAALLTYELFAGVVELGLAYDLTHIVTVTDARLERILRRANWPLQRMGETIQIGDTRAVAGLLDISADVLARLRSRGNLKRPVLWAPIAPTRSA